MQHASKYRIALFACVFAGVLTYSLVPQQVLVEKLAALQPSAGQKAIAPTALAMHKALYSFKMVAADAGSGLNGIKGQMYFEQEDTCDAWTTEHRFTTEYQYAERGATVETSRYVSYEGKDGKAFSFNSERQENAEAQEQLRGSVEIAADGSAKAIYSRPEETRYDLPTGYLLPSAHTLEVIRRARLGESFFSSVLFDGTDADGPVEITAFIGKKASAEELDKIAVAAGKKIDGTLLTPDAWHVRMAVFPLIDAEEETPAYEMNMILHDNGVVSYVYIDYKTFALEQNLVALERLPMRNCR